MQIPSDLMVICEKIREWGGRPYIVGGAVRDSLLNIEPKDYDVEVFGLCEKALLDCLSPFGTVDTVGASYQVIKVRSQTGEYDFSVPRRERKTGPKHTDFETEADPDLSLFEAAQRRDFTINAMYYDPINRVLRDPTNGQIRLYWRTLGVVSRRFSEDPLRVLRAFRFVSQLDFTPSPQLIDYSQVLKYEYRHLPKERVWGEWYRWATKSIKPSRGLMFLKNCDWLGHYSTLAALDKTPQHPEHHPEGNVWIHTLYGVDWMATKCVAEGITGLDRAVLMFAILCHDFGKATTTTFNAEKGHYVSYGHEEAGVEPTREFLESIGAPKALIERVLPLVANHLAHISFTGPSAAGKPAVRRLARRLTQATITELALVIEADHSARPPKPQGQPEGLVRLLELAAETAVTQEGPKPILLGRHLLELGVKPGKHMGELLREMFEAQLDGVFDDLESAIRRVKLLLKTEEMCEAVVRFTNGSTISFNKEASADPLIGVQEPLDSSE